MYRIYFPNLDLDLQNEDIDVLRKIIVETINKNYIIQEYGWMEVESEKVVKNILKDSYVDNDRRYFRTP